MKRLVSLVTAGVLLAGCGTTGGTPSSASTSSGAATPTTSPTSIPTTDPMVDIGGRSLYLECRGSGSPTVILEAGLTGDHRTWEQVAPELNASRVCVYDRANVPPSDAAAVPRTAQDAVDDLETLLEAAEIGPPYVLVGFSFGGLISQLYARTHPDDVGGIVLVESNHPEEAEQFEAHLTAEQIAEDRAAVLDNSEGMDPYASFEQVQQAGPMPQVPLVVVTAGLSEGWPPGWDAELFDQLRAEQQADLAAMVPGGRQVFAEESSHNVPGTQPEVIVDAIASVLADI